MARPGKPAVVLLDEKKSHRTKAEIQKRQEEEEKLLSHEAMKESKQVRENERAHSVYLRVKKLLKNIEKNDALYEGAINRYCMLCAECEELVEKREYFFNLSEELKNTFDEAVKDQSSAEKAALLIEFTREIARVAASMNMCDKQIQAKRKMLLEIEKENVMTVAAAVRTVPKKEDKEDDPVLKLLKGG